MSIKRYEAEAREDRSGDPILPEMVEYPDGDFVEYEDHLELLTACQLEIEQLRADNFRLSNRAWALAFLAYPIGAAREAVAGDLGLGCSDCGVHFVPGARHFSGCKSHPGEPAPQEAKHE